MRYRYACLRKPGREIIHGLSQRPTSIPDFDNAARQHVEYAASLKKAGVEIAIADADPRFADGCFVEDTHLVLPELTIRLNPGAPSRREEPDSLRMHLPRDRPYEHVPLALNIDGGDILVMQNRIYVGLSSRTQLEAVLFLDASLKPHGYQVIAVEVPDSLHLKSGVTALDNDTLIATATFAELPLIQAAGQVFTLPEHEDRGANILAINDSVLIPPSCPELRHFITSHAPTKQIIEVDTSEFAKLDGALTCLSLLW